MMAFGNENRNLTCSRMGYNNFPLQWRHNGRDSVSNHRPHYCFPNRLIRRRSKKTSKPRVTGHCAGNSPGTSEFPAQMASNAENVSIWLRHHAIYNNWIFTDQSQTLTSRHLSVISRTLNDIPGERPRVWWHLSVWVRILITYKHVYILSIYILFILYSSPALRILFI